MIEIFYRHQVSMKYFTISRCLESGYDNHFILLKETIGANVMMGQEQLDAGPRKHSAAVLTLK